LGFARWNLIEELGIGENGWIQDGEFGVLFSWEGSCLFEDCAVVAG